MQCLRPHKASRQIGNQPQLLTLLLTLLLLCGLVSQNVIATVLDSTVFPNDPANNPSSAPGGDMEVLLVSLRINQQMMQQPAVMLRNASGEWWIPVPVLTLAKVKIPDASVRRFNDTDYIAVASLPIEGLSFDAATLLMDIRLSAEGFTLNRLQTRASQRPETTTRSAGAFLNYDLLLDHGEGGFGHVVFTEVGGAVGAGVGVSTQMLVNRPNLDRWLRLDRSYVIDDLSQITTLRVGDGISRPPPLLGRPVRFAGLQWGTNFRVRPDLTR